MNADASRSISLQSGREAFSVAAVLKARCRAHHPSVKGSSLIYYGAYGANLNQRQMLERTSGEATVIGAALLLDHQLEFRLGVLTVLPCPGKSVPLGIWKISEKAKHALDYFEGAPSLYVSRTVKRSAIKPIVGDVPEALMLYEMTSEAANATVRSHVPSESYFETCSQGYLDFGLKDWLSLLEGARFRSQCLGSTSASLRSSQSSKITSDTRKKIYIAGPDVFFPNIEALAKQQKTACDNLDLIATHPIDQPELKAEVIFRNNIALLREADGVIANLNPFRGAEVDTGTAFEVGFAVATGKPVVGYVSEAHTMLERVATLWGPIKQDEARNTWHDKDGNLIENFNYRVNLMIGVSCQVVVGDFRAALGALKRMF